MSRKQVPQFSVVLGGNLAWIVDVNAIFGCTLGSQYPLVLVNDNLKTKSGLDTLLHECMHTQNPDAAEEWVATRATELTEVLWKLGYRIPKGKA